MLRCAQHDMTALLLRYCLNSDNVRERNLFCVKPDACLTQRRKDAKNFASLGIMQVDLSPNLIERLWRTNALTHPVEGVQQALRICG